MSIDIVTRGDLYRLRTALTSLRESIVDLAVAGTPVPAEMQDLEIALRRRTVGVEVPCVLCKVKYPVYVRVGDEPPSWPSSVLCGDCDDKTMVLVETP